MINNFLIIRIVKGSLLLGRSWSYNISDCALEKIKDMMLFI